jgi:transcriptional regulator with XRE-family HTH domain
VNGDLIDLVEMASKNHDNYQEFSRVLEQRIKQSGLSDREVARKAGISNGLLSGLRSGNNPPTLKVCIPLAWALNENPLFLYKETHELLKYAGQEPRVKSARTLAETLEALDEKAIVWIYAPDNPEVIAKSKGVCDRLNVTIFTRIEHARPFWESNSGRPKSGKNVDDKVPGGADRPCFVKTPGDELLTRDGPLLVIHPHKEYHTELHQWLPDFEEDLLLRVPITQTHIRFIKALASECEKMNVYELSVFERDESTPGSAIIVYTQTFPEIGDDIESKRLYETVENNLRDGKRYLYLNTAVDKDITRHQFKRLYFRLKESDVPIDKFNFHILDTKDAELTKEQTLLLYVIPPEKAPTGNPEDLTEEIVRNTYVTTLVTQVPGLPLKFKKADQNEVARTGLNLLKRLLTNTGEAKDSDGGFKEWLLMKKEAQ